MLFLAACGDLIASGTPPRLDPIGNKKVLVGEKLAFIISATDPDGDDLTFFVDGRPASAQFVALDDGKSALFTWIPEVTASEPGGKIHEVEFFAEDSTGAFDSEVVEITVFPQWAPAFLNPPGYVLDLSEENHIEFMVEVKDDSASHVEISVDTGPEGSYLEKADKKKAYFSWRPDDVQIATKLFWYVRFKAVGYASDPNLPGQETQLYTITHDIVIVITNADWEGCPGSPPSIDHTPPGDVHWDSSDPYPGYALEASVSDWDSYVDRVNLFYTTGDPEISSAYSVTSLTAQNPEHFTGYIPKISAGGGKYVYYYLEVWDNDDYAGSNCDHASRLPKQGAFSFVAYDPGYESSCLEDSHEPNDSFTGSEFLDPGSYGDLRLCGDNHDWFLFAVLSPEVAITVDSYGSNSTVTEIVNNSGQKVQQAATGSFTANITAQMLPSGMVGLHIYSESGQPATYAVSVVPQSQSCQGDELEPNDTPAKAVLVGEGEFNDLTVCPGDQDYFRLEIPSGTTLSALVDHSVAQGDLDLFLLGSDGNTVLSQAQTSTDDEVLSSSIPQGGTHYLRVQGFNGSAAGYNLVVTYDKQSEVCLEDSFAPNQYEDEAVMTPASKYGQLTACPGKSDWFAIGLNGGETLQVEVSASSLSVKIVDGASGNTLCNGSGSGSGTKATCSVPGPGTYKFQVANPSGLAVTYDLTVTVTEDMSVCHDDRFEENDTPGGAAEVMHSVVTQLKACGADEDWFHFQGYPQEYVFSGLYFANPASIADVTLYNDTGTTVLAMSNTSAGQPFLEYQLPSMGVYFLKVKSGDFYGNIAYDLFLWIQ